MRSGTRPAGSTVDVKMESAGQTVRICVRDSGPGVPEELLPKIFQPFFRVDDSRDSSTGGVGLGPRDRLSGHQRASWAFVGAERESRVKRVH